MTPEASKMKSIWYLVSLVLLEMGGLVLLAGIIDLVVPSGRRTVLADIHPGLWWGCIMIVAGLVFYLKHRK
jgi:thiamine transporter ThiT